MWQGWCCRVEVRGVGVGGIGGGEGSLWPALQPLVVLWVLMVMFVCCPRCLSYFAHAIVLPTVLQCEPHVVKYLRKAVRRGRHTAVPLVTALAGGLARRHPSLAVALVDGLLEDVRWGLETPAAGEA